MRIGVLSDTHIPEKAFDIPKPVLDAFRKVDMIIHAGDLADITVLETLKNICPDVRAVCGNMDNPSLRNKLPEKELLEVGGYRIGIMHGFGHPDKLIEVLARAFKDDLVDIIVFGHSHRGYKHRHGKVLYFNPGSPTDRVFAPYNSYGIIEISDKIEAKIIKF